MWRVFLALAFILTGAAAQAQTLTPVDLAHRAMERRAVEAVIWACGQASQLGADRPRSQFELLFRPYRPEKPLFEKTWKLPDIEKVAAQQDLHSKTRKVSAP